MLEFMTLIHYATLEALDGGIYGYLMLLLTTASQVKSNLN